MKRGAASRARWSWNGLARLGLEELPNRTNQDQRDAIAAAVTARQHALALTESIGEIVVPARVPGRAGTGASNGRSHRIRPPSA